MAISAPIEATTPQELGLDVGLLYYATQAAPTVAIFLGATRGGNGFTPGTEWRNVEYDGKRSAVAQLDRKIMHSPELTTTLIQGKMGLFEPGSVAAVGVAPITELITPSIATILQPDTAYLYNVWWLTRTGSNDATPTPNWRRLTMPIAFVQAYVLGSTDQEEQSWELTIQPRLAFADAIVAATADNAPYLWETMDADFTIP